MICLARWATSSVFETLRPNPEGKDPKVVSDSTMASPDVSCRTRRVTVFAGRTPVCSEMREVREWGLAAASANTWISVESSAFAKSARACVAACASSGPGGAGAEVQAATSINSSATMPMYAKELNAAVRAAQAATRLIRASAGQLVSDQVSRKGFKDLVTSTDVAAQDIIIRILNEACPDYGIVAEEQGGEARFGEPRWIIDPIDGTVNFAHGLPPFAVSIALENEGATQVGVVLEAARGELFTAIRGQGTFRNGAPVTVSSRPRLKSSVVATGFPFKSFGTLSEQMEVLQRFLIETRGVRRFGAASLDLAYVACGLFDGFYESDLKVWDIAAGSLLITEAGGRVSDFGGETGHVDGTSIVATNGWVHEEMLLLVTPLRGVR